MRLTSRVSAKQSAALAEGRYLGLGLACYVERTGTGPFEGATVRVESDGHVLVMTGATPQGKVIKRSTLRCAPNALE